MAATATARTAPARKPAPRRTGAPARRRRTQSTPVGGFVPVAVGRTAGAVGGLADSGLLVWLTRGRIWIGVLGSLLVGIVALNVMALSFSASSSTAGRAADQLKLQNSTLRAQVATRLSSEEVQQAAQKLGLIVPEPGAISYLRPSADDAAEAARRLRNGELSTSTATSTYVAPTTEVPVDPAAAVDPATVAPAADPAATATTTATTDPAATAPVTTPTAPPATTPTAGGGIGAP